MLLKNINNETVEFVSLFLCLFFLNFVILFLCVSFLVLS